jgi:hypothetical protein
MLHQVLGVCLFVVGSTVIFHDIHEGLFQDQAAGDQARMAWVIHGLPKVLPGPAMPNPSTPCGRAAPKTAVSGVARRKGGRPAAVFNPLGYLTPFEPAGVLVTKNLHSLVNLWSVHALWMTILYPPNNFGWPTVRDKNKGIT